MSDLQAAIAGVLGWHIDDSDMPTFVRDDHNTVIEAARRVANPDIEAATAITYDLRYVKDGDDWDDQIEDVTKRAVNAALGVSE